MADLNDTNAAQTVKIVGSEPSSGTENYFQTVNSQGQASTSTVLADSPNLDAFGRLRVSQPFTVFDASFPVDTSPLLFSTATATGGTITNNTNISSVLLNTTTASGSSAQIQSRRYFTYEPGKSFLILMTGNIGAAKANVTQRLGYFDANNGLFFEQTSSGISVVRRTFTSGAAVNNTVLQSDWNLDKLDGTGVSGITLDTSKQLIFLIDFQWLGSGRVRFGFCIEGITRYVHQMTHSNILTVPYMTTGTLPIRAELVNTGATASSTSLVFNCTSVQSEAGYAPGGLIRFVANSTAKTVPGSGTYIPVLSIRKKTGNTQWPVKIEEISAIVTTADDVILGVFINSTLTGASYTALTGICEFDVAATALSGGTQIAGNFIRSAAGSPSTLNSSSIFNNLSTIMGSDILGNSDVITIAIKNITSASTAYAAITYREIT